MDITDYLNELATSIPKLCSSDAQLLRLSRYETKFGIYDHSNSNDATDPLALVRMHWSENALAVCRLYERHNQFIDMEVHKFTGLSLTEFFAQPSHICNNQLKKCAERLKENEPSAAVLAALQKLGDT